MAIVSSSRGRSTTWIFSLKALLLSTAALSTAYAFKISVPAMREFLFSELPQIWTSVLSWLTPPYLYFVINGIIITIAASSKFQQQKADEPQENAPEKIATAMPTSYEVPAGYEAEAMVLKNPAEIRPDFQVAAAAAYGELEARACEEEVKEAKEEEDFVISRSDWEPRRRVSTEHSISTEKPPVSVRIGHKKSVKASPEGSRALGVAKSKRHETLENTWKTITEGRAMPLTRHLKKSDTWETHGRQRGDGHDHHPKPVMKKSETAKDRNTTASPSPSPGKLLRKESSLSQDELNRRVEAFIKKFNEEMRLQRQESIKHYQEMVNRGTH